MSLKMLFLGILLLVGGILVAYFGYFVYPEYFLYGAGLAGLVAVLTPVFLIFLGIGFIYGSFGKEEVPSLAPPTVALIDERIDIEGKQYVDKEFSHCKKHLDPNEKILALIEGNVGEKPELNRLALTDRRIIFYPRGKSNGAITFDYKQIDTIKGKRGKILTHLGEVTLYTKGRTLSFKNMLEEYIDQIVDMTSKMKQKATTTVKES